MKGSLHNNQKEPEFSDAEIFYKIWWSPRQVFRFIITEYYDRYLLILLTLAGIARACERASSQNYGDTKGIWEILALCVLGGGLFGVISYYFYAALISWTGKWFEGEGHTMSILRIMSYAMLPSIVSFLLLLIQIGVSGEGVFKSEGEIIYSGWRQTAFLYLLNPLRIILALWSVVLFIIGIAEVQKLSVGKSILNLLAAGAFFMLPFVLFAIFAYLSNF